MSLNGDIGKDVAVTQLPNSDFDPVIRLGLWCIAAGFGGFLLWSIFAPLDEGVPALGTVSVESKRKHIEHLTGGIVEKILVRDGEKVHAGQPLIVLNETQAKASLSATLSQWRTAIATEVRLTAEREGRNALVFPKELLEAQSNPEVNAAMRGQRALIASRRTALEGELSIIRESVRGLESQIASLDELLIGREKQVKLFREQLASYKKLNTDGFISRNQLIDIERQLAEVQTKQSEDLSNIAGVRARLAEFRMRGAQREIEYRREVESQLADVQRDLATLRERVVSQRDVHQRLVLNAPVTGTVMELAFNTVGGVVNPGERIMDIVPMGDELIVEARVEPQYIDRVHVGLLADVHFDAYMNDATRPVATGKVILASADAVVDPRSGSPYYAIRVSVPDAEIEKLGSLKLRPGMQATVMIKTGQRSLLAYMLRPVFRRFTPALSER